MSDRRGATEAPGAAGAGGPGPRHIPYGRQWVDDEDVSAVVEVLRSDWLTTGPTVDRFEAAVAEFTGAAHAVAIANGTAALHASIYAAGIGPGDEVIVPAMTFAASANCAVYQGARPVFADVERDTLLVDAASVAALVTPRTKAVVAVDYAGQPCDYDALRAVAGRHGLLLIDDASHAIGGEDKGRAVGTLADLNTFSFHPVKHITTGEGGAVTTGDAELARRLRLFRNHGITTDHRQREQQGSWFYEMVDLGYNYRLNDLQCALGVSQLRRLRAWVARRREIARRYDEAFAELKTVEPLGVRPDALHAYHIYVVRLNLERLKVGRAEVFRRLRAQGIGVNVHYIPVHLHPFYRERFGTGPGLCPVAEAAYERIVTLPLFPAMRDDDVEAVVEAVRGVEGAYAR
jgi:perosamine synthetase